MAATFRITFRAFNGIQCNIERHLTARELATRTNELYVNGYEIENIEREELEEEEEFEGIEDSPCLQNCDDWGTGEGAYHGRI